MLTSRKRGRGKPCSEGLNPFKDVERIANLLMQEAQTSLAQGARITGKLIAVSAVGFLLTSSCCSSHYLVPLGVLILAMAAGWLDAIGNECKLQCFFPYKALNSVGASLFRWQWVAFWACTLFGLSTLYSCTLTGVVHFLQSGRSALPEVWCQHFYERLWMVCKMAVVPLSLMLLGRAIEPYRFRTARADILKAEKLVCQLVATRTASDISALATLVAPETIPFYKLGSVAKLLHDFVDSYDATDKLKIVLAHGQESMQKWQLHSESMHKWQNGCCNRFQRLLSMANAPFRRVTMDLLMWESRDVVLYAVAAIYVALVYVGSLYSPVPDACMLFVLVPFLGPKSRAARYVQALQENIRLAQGKTAEKKGGMTPAWLPEEGFTGLNWPMVIFLGGMHATAIYALAVLLLFGCVCPVFGQGAPVKPLTFVLAALLYFCSALGITGGSHRLWAHRSYKACLPLRIVLMIFSSISNQGSIFGWARDHRVHHLYSDTAADPHDSNRGFWFSHVGWLLVRENTAVLEAMKKVNVEDLKSDPIVMLQYHADPFWNLLWCFAFPAFTALMLGDTAWNGFLIAGVLRYIAVLNATWAVNSVVHRWGSRPYNPAHQTADNGWVSVFAIGEGWHNWHHAFGWDYAAAELGALQQFNPTKVFIDIMAFLGLAWDRKRGLNVWAQRKARWEETQGRKVVESLEGPPLFKHRVVTFGPEPYDDHHHDHDESAVSTDPDDNEDNTRKRTRCESRLQRELEIKSPCE